MIRSPTDRRPGLRGLPGTVWLIGLISLVNDSASELLYPLLPLYLSSVLMAGPRALGVIEGVAEATASLLKLFSGVMVDRTRRAKPWVVSGYGLAGLTRPLIAFVASWPWLLVLRFADRVGKGLRSSPRDALLAASVGPGQRGLAFGLHRAMDNAGAVIGPLLAALLLAAEMPLRDIFLWSALPGAVCLALALALREPRHEAAPAPVRFDWRLEDMPAAFKRYLVVVALFTLGNSSNLFLLLRARELGVPEAQVPLLWAAVSLVAALFSTPLAALSDRWGRVRLLVAGYLAYGIFYLALGTLVQGGPVLFALFAFYGLFMAATEGVEKALVADLAPAGRRGTAFGWFNLTAGVMLLPASVIFGWLYQSLSPLAAFAFSGACALASASLLVAWAAATVEVEYTKVYAGKEERIKEAYTIYAGPVTTDPAGTPTQRGAFFSKAKVNKVDPEFADRLYFVNNFLPKAGKGTRAVWNNPVGGALEWNYYPVNFIIDTKGEIRWALNAQPIYDINSIYRAGVMMGFKQGADGALTWGYGQRYVKYDIMGKEIFNRQLPAAYNDFSHSLDLSPNGNYFLRVGSANYKRSDGKNVRTVRDVIAEIEPATGRVVDDWRLYEILDPYRDVNLKVLDQGAVCLNIDANLASHTMTADDLAKQDKDDKFGDIVGVGPGRNWAHVNSVDHDAEDDSIIISSRHQSAMIKIGRDKKVKWIVGSPEAWKGELATKVLTPVDAKGQKIKCENSKCEGDFDWTWTQHTAFKIDSMSKGDTLYLSAFDNGDSRGMEQPALPSMKYSRAVVYKIDQKKMTVEQVWEYGKERGNAWYSPVTSLTEYQADKNSVFVYSAVAGADFDISTGAFKTDPNPYIDEFKWGAKEPSVEIQLMDTTGYQAMPFSVEKALGK